MLVLLSHQKFRTLGGKCLVKMEKAFNLYNNIVLERPLSHNFYYRNGYNCSTLFLPLYLSRVPVLFLSIIYHLSPIFQLSTYHLSTYLPIIYLSIHSIIYLSIYLSSIYPFYHLSLFLSLPIIHPSIIYLSI